MAEIAVRIAFDKVSDVQLLKTLNTYIASKELNTMQMDLHQILSFLQDPVPKPNENPDVKQLVEAAVNTARKIDDVIDLFLIEISGQISDHPEFLDEIKEILVNLNTIAEKTKKFFASREKSIWRAPKMKETLCWSPNFPAVGEVVGFDSHKDRVVYQLDHRRMRGGRRTVLSIVGMGGLGKTTLAAEVYKSLVKRKFFDCCAWLSVSHEYDLTSLMRELLWSIDKMKEPAVINEDLQVEIENSLSQKRYLIVLDNVWAIHIWHQLKKILPDTYNRSRVLITTRYLKVAVAADPETKPYMLPYLNNQDSLTLLLSKADHRLKTFHEIPNHVDPPLMEVAEKLANQCGGLPLALTVLGGILKERGFSYSAWKRLEQTMDMFDDEEWKKCFKVFVPGYKDLPYHLKACFLYFASFPQGHKISAKHVSRLWMAERLISTDGRTPKDQAQSSTDGGTLEDKAQSSTDGRTLEDKAQSYLEELEERGLVQVMQKSGDDPKYFTVHNLLRLLAVRESKEYNFLTVFENEDDYFDKKKNEDDYDRLDANVPNRVTLQFCNPERYANVLPTNTRSLHFFGQYISTYDRFKLLRVLTFVGVNMRKKEACYEGWLKGLINLRYLGFIDCGLLPREFGRVSFGSLNNLETIEIRKSKIWWGDEPHHSLWEVPTLKHVISTSPIQFTCHMHLQNLQILKWVSLQNFPELAFNMNLLKLGLFLGTDYWEKCPSVEKARDQLKGLLKQMKHLVSLSVYSTWFLPIPAFHDNEVPYHYHDIQCLSLSGEMKTSYHVMLPRNLTKLTLKNTEVEDDPMPVLGSLKKLRVLKLLQYSFLGRSLIFGAEYFPSLQKLQLDELPNLGNLRIRKEAMPELIQLQIGRCDNLGHLPDLGNLITLKDLIVRWPSKELLSDMQFWSLHQLEHIETVKIELQSDENQTCLNLYSDSDSD